MRLIGIIFAFELLTGIYQGGGEHGRVLKMHIIIGGAMYKQEFTLKAGSHFRKSDFDQVTQYLVQRNLPLGILVRFDVDTAVTRRVLRPFRANL